jgi:hypothetical protein
MRLHYQQGRKGNVQPESGIPRRRVYSRLCNRKSPLGVVQYSQILTILPQTENYIILMRMPFLVDLKDHEKPGNHQWYVSNL